MNTQTPSQSPYLSKLISAISNIDIQTLEELLSDDYCYCGASKFIIMKKFEELFDFHKLHGDSFLHVKQGNCNGSCTLKDEGFIFIGNVSHHYFSLLFKELDTDYIDFRSCSHFYVESNDLPLNERNDLVINRNERLNFSAYPQLKEKMNTAEKALRESKDFASPLSYEVFSDWVKKYQYLSEQISLFDYDYSFLQEFKNLHDLLSLFSHAFEVEPQCKVANIAYQNLNLDDDKEIIVWWEKYAELENSVIQFVYVHEEEALEVEENRIVLGENLVFIHEYYEVAKFQTNFYEHSDFPNFPYEIPTEHLTYEEE